MLQLSGAYLMCYPSQAPLLLVVMCSVDRLVLTPDDARLVLLQLFSRHPRHNRARASPQVRHRHSPAAARREYGPIHPRA